MKENILRARIKVLGGDKLIETFDDFAKHGAFAMKLVDKEAEKATREVQKLKRQLEELDLVARSIRAKIKIDKDRGPTAAQAASLALAENLERQAAITRQKIAAAEQGLFMDPGRMARTLSQGLNQGMDLFDADRLGREISDALKAADLGEAILSKADRTAIEKVAKNFQKITSKTRDDLSAGIAVKDRAAAEKAEEKAIADAERAQRKADADSKARLDEAGKRLDEAHRRNMARIRAEADEDNRLFDERERHRKASLADDEKALKEFAAAGERYRRNEYESWWKGQLDKRDAQRKIEAETRRAAEQARLDEEEFDRRRVISLQKAEAAAARRAPRPSAPAARPVAREAVRDVKGVTNAGKEAEQAAKKISSFDRAVANVIHSVSALDRAGAGVGRVFSGISRGASGALSDLKAFTGALKNFEHALGNVALRTGVAALILGIADALAVLGGGAALAGIAALAGLAAFDAAKLKRFADANNMTLESFTAIRYAAARSGVAFDDYTAAVEKSREALLGVHKGEKQYEDAAALAAKYHISLYKKDLSDVADFKDFLRQITEVYNQLPKGIQRTALLKAFGIEALEPLVAKTNKGLTELIIRARKVGVVLTDADVSKWEEMRSAIWDTWEILKGIGYKLSSVISPDLMPVLQAINKWLLDNSDLIVKFLVDSFNYLMQVVKDFWAMWNGHPEFVKKGWVKSVWDFHKAVIDVFKAVGKAIYSTFKLVEQPLQKLHDLLFKKDGEESDPNGGLKVALTAVGASLLGVTGLAVSFGEVISGAFKLVRGAAALFLEPILGIVGGIVGWPVALVAGGALITAYWDEIGAAFQKAWAKFKETFPNAAAKMEETFGKAKATVLNFVDDTWSRFQERYPNIAKLITDVRDGVQNLITELGSTSWEEMGGSTWELLKTTFDGLALAIDKIVPGIRYLAEGTKWSVGVIAGAANDLLKGFGAAGDWVGSWGRDSALQKFQDSVNMTREQQAEYLRRGRELYNTEQVLFGGLNKRENDPNDPMNRSFFDVVGGWQPMFQQTEASIRSMADQAERLNRMTVPGTETSVLERNLAAANDATVLGKYMVELSTDQSSAPVTLATNDPEIGRMLTQAAAGRAKIAADPSWNRRF